MSATTRPGDSNDSTTPGVEADPAVPHLVPFTLRQLQMFVTVAEAGTISRAAERLYVSETGVSLAINQLERTLGVKLLNRRRAHGVTVTTTGQSVLASARQILGEAGDLYEEISGTGDLTGGLSLGCFPSIGPTMMPLLVRTFLENHPHVALRFREDSPEVLHTDLEAGLLDLIVTYDLGLPQNVRQLPLLDLRPCVLVGEDHWAAHREGPVDLAELADEPYVLLDNPVSANHSLSLCRSAGFEPRVGYKSQNFETVRSFVGRGLGWTINLMRPKVGTTHEGLSIVTKEITDDVGAVRIVAAWPQGRPLSRNAKAFLELARDVVPDSM
ncbi:LysR substrate-binding domain-containing protein [Georgenia sp. SYP-B2076]|uniref:LysR substrate-binding domain-containing protein n=1 Tax=Georgenia sp. SYP-B2076 TaxID=2495881 RepID=UPI000F8E3510|nr:LysR substrate-binding domain-containing protein [Georgenia sp. SYP-B2076]